MAQQTPSRLIVENFFGADLRSLGLMRIAVAVVLLADLIQRSGDLLGHYTDFGVLPRAALIENDYSRWHISLHLINGTWEVQAILFAMAGVFALLLLVGYRTRVVTVVCWFLYLSLRTRNTLLWADALLCEILFWAIFLPWGARFSLDKTLRTSWDTLPERCLSWGTVAYVMQIVFVFWFGALLKSGPEWRVEGSAVYYALSVDQLATPLGLFLVQFPLVLKVLTFGVFWFEIFGSLLLFCPFWTGPIRTAVIFGFMLMFLGFGLCLVIGIFVWISAAALIGLLPSWFWERITVRWSSTNLTPIKHYYAQASRFCILPMGVIQGLRGSASALFLPTQDDTSVKSDIRAVPSSVVIEKIVGKIDRTVARHQKMRWVPEHSLPSDKAPAFSLGKVQSLFIVALLLYVFVWNSATVPGSGVRISEPYQSIGVLLGLEQSWSMFAPSPLKHDGWYVIPGKLKNGRQVDLFRDGKEITWTKPTLVSATYKNFRWQKYMMNLLRTDYQKYRLYYAQYLCRDWNARHTSDLKLEELQMFFLLEFTLPNNEYSTPEKTLLLTHRCAEPRKALDSAS